MVLSIATLVLAFVAFAVVHSLTAGGALPARLKQILPDRLVEGWYRLAYNAFSVISFVPVMALTALQPDSTIYDLTGIVMVALRGIQLLALIALAWALVSIDFWRFVGLRQALAYLDGGELPLPDEPLASRGVYAVMRHPLYVFSLMFLWATPVMTVNGLTFNVCATLYFVIGAAIEERRLLTAFGDQYETYRTRVGVLGMRGERRS